jgi:phosphoglycolate phosphatase-like HAD superfamily hydrolase
MRQVLTLLESQIALYIGDTIDDLRTVLAFRSLPEAASVTLLSAQVLTGTTPRAVAPALFADTDILADDVNAVLRLLAKE